jgi:hypothetical protein
MGDLVNFGDLTKPATTLIEKISNAIGAFYKPTHIEKVGQAEAKAKQYAAIMEAETQIQITEIQKRGLQRSICEEGIKQQNIEDITLKAIPRLSTDAKPENIENDWLAHFFDKCRLTSDEQMQQLWANILAGEANLPSSFSKRTIDLVASLDKQDAVLFTKLCNFCWVDGLYPLIYNYENDIYIKNGINFAELLHLDSIGFIKFESITGFARPNLPRLININYFNNVVCIEFNSDNNNLEIGQVVFTQVGKQLAKICDAIPFEEYYNYVLHKWINECGYTIYTPILRKSKPL